MSSTCVSDPLGGAGGQRVATRVSGMALGQLFSEGQEPGSDSSERRDELAFGSYSSAVLSSLRPFCKANNKQSNSNPSEEDGIFHSLGFLKCTSLAGEKGMLALLSS